MFDNTSNSMLEFVFRAISRQRINFPIMTRYRFVIEIFLDIYTTRSHGVKVNFSFSGFQVIIESNMSLIYLYQILIWGPIDKAIRRACGIFLWVHNEKVKI